MAGAHCSRIAPATDPLTETVVPRRTMIVCGDSDKDRLVVAGLDCAEALAGAVWYVSTGLVGFPPPETL